MSSEQINKHSQRTVLAMAIISTLGSLLLVIILVLLMVHFLIWLDQINLI